MDPRVSPTISPCSFAQQCSEALEAGDRLYREFLEQRKREIESWNITEPAAPALAILQSIPPWIRTARANGETSLSVCTVKSSRHEPQNLDQRSREVWFFLHKAGFSVSVEPSDSECSKDYYLTIHF
ncbi:MAG: hypothetical protein JSS83_28290 [Cyanobacteria bacterium SZAS LIN-3]|nr:hypothetical protein [Cyanobacteria bacterium SZAS LIN-3]MBS2007356.1 hypothetical protein [Cyanobacteria bacterium SZAS TMP-1]